MTALVPPDSGPSADQVLLAAMLDDLATRQVDAQIAVRQWRNFTLSLAAALLVALPLFCLLAPHLGGSLVTIRHDATEGTSSLVQAEVETRDLSSGDLAAIALWGALGGTVGVIAALGRIRLSSRPTSLQFALLVLKPLAGAAVALFGVVLTQGGLFTQLRPVSSGAIAAYAALFGFAQELLTRLVDRRANALIGAATPGDRP